MNEEQDSGLGFETTIEIDGQKYPVRYLPGEGLLLHPQDLVKLFPLVDREHAKLPLAVLNELAGRVLMLIEEHAGVVELVRHHGGVEETRLCSVCGEPQLETSSGWTCGNGHGGSPALEQGQQPLIKKDAPIKELKKHKVKPLKLGSLAADMAAVGPNPELMDVGIPDYPPADPIARKLVEKAPKNQGQVYEADYIDGKPPVACDHCGEEKWRLTHKEMGRDKAGRCKWRCGGCGYTLRTFDRHAKELVECYSPAFKGPDPDKLSAFYSDEGFKLSDEQHQAVARIMKSTKPVVLVTGLAGTGKSAVIRVLQKYYNLTTCATTGKAALNVDGITIDSLTSLNRDTWRVRSSGVQKWAMEQSSKKIIVDECSMIGRNMADFLMQVAQLYGRQWIWFGDYGQAQPVKDGSVLKSRALVDYEFIKLEECHRQQQGPYLEALNKVRIGQVDDQVEAVFSNCVQPQAPEDDRFIRMFATNNATDGYNQMRLRQMQDEGKQSWPLKATFRDLRKREKIQQYGERDPRFQQRKIDDSNMADNLRFVVGAQVVFTMNDVGGSRQFVNGDTGVIVEAWAGRQRVKELDFGPFSGEQATVDKVRIRMHRTDMDLELKPVAREFKNGAGDPDCEVVGFPFKLGYALTIHKAQGMTVDRAWVDMSTIMVHPMESRCGLAYVALSRTRTLEGLKISEWVPGAVACNEELLPLM